MFKRLISVLLPVILTLAFPLAARADVIVGPENNGFWNRNYNNCVYLNRNFYANGDKGYVSLRSSPGARSAGQRIKNGEILNISFVYNLNGSVWGITQLREQAENPWDGPSGWMPMDDLLVAYDYVSFEEDHRDEIYFRSEVFDLLPARCDVVFWAWPGSGEIVHILEAKWRTNRETERNFLSDDKPAYTDPEGREWVFINYLFGRVNAWVLLDDPELEDVPVFHPAPAPVPWRPGPEHLVQHGGEPQSQGFLIIIIALLILVTAVLIGVFRKKRRSKPA